MANHMGGYPASPAGMTPQQQQQQMMMQRMQQAQQTQGGMGTPTHQRQFSAPQGTPNPGQQSQFGTPQNPQAAPQNQTPTPAPPSATSVTTPQTPTFPQPGQGPSINGNSTPASPGTQARDQERLSLLLDINMDLLYEVVHLKHTLDELKREATMATTPELQKEKREEEAAFNQDYVQYVKFPHLIQRLPELTWIVQNFQETASKSLLSSTVDNQQGRRLSSTGPCLPYGTIFQPEAQIPADAGTRLGNREG